MKENFLLLLENNVQKEQQHFDSYVYLLDLLILKHARLA